MGKDKNKKPVGHYSTALKMLDLFKSGYTYEIDGKLMSRNEAVNYIILHPNEHYVINRYSPTASTADKQNKELNWQTLGNDGTWVDNNDYWPEEGNLDELVVRGITHLQQDMTTYLQHAPIIDLDAQIPNPYTFVPESNMWHRKKVAAADAYVKEALSERLVNNIYDYLAPSTWAGLAGKAIEGGYSFNDLTDPTLNNYGWLTLHPKTREWAKKHPEETFAINFTSDILFPYGIKGVKTAANTVYKTGMEYRLANELNKSVQLGIRPRWNNNMMYRRALLQEADDLMYSGEYRELPEGKTVPQNLNSNGAIKRRLINRERLRNGKYAIPEMHKSGGNSHGGKSFAKGLPWQGTTSSGSTANELILETPGQDIQVGHHGSYSEVMPFGDIEIGSGLWRKFGETGETGISAEGTTIYRPKPDGTYEIETINGNEPNHFRIRLGDVEINNPLLSYRLAKPGTAQNFLDTGYAFTPEETANIIAEEEGLFIPTLRQRAGIDPGFPLAYPMYTQGSLWFGVPTKGTSIPDLIVTAKHLRPANSKSYPIKSYSKAQGRRMSEVVGEVTPDNASVYVFDPNYGYRKLVPQEQYIQDIFNKIKKFKNDPK